jgi:hypothetical protein
MLIRERRHLGIYPLTQADVSYLLNQHSGMLTSQTGIGSTGGTGCTEFVTALTSLERLGTAASIALKLQRLQLLAFHLVPDLAIFSRAFQNLTLSQQRKRPTKKNPDNFDELVHDTSFISSGAGYFAEMYSATA